MSRMNFTDIILLSLSILIPLLFLVKPVLRYRKSTDEKNIRIFLKENIFELLTILFLMLGFVLRLYKIGQIPLGFNQDEASIGYDAYAILNYGIDRNGISIPVHLISWGSGQNSLYAYICMPFIKLFGLTEFAIRLPMAVIGCMSLLVLKKTLNIIGSSKLAAIGTFVFAIMPWHIMKSRWALESNILPDVILLASLLIILGIKGKKRWLYFGSFILGLSAYAYGTSYFFLPVFTLIIFIYLLYQKKILIRHALISLGIIIATALPIILFVLINQFGWDSITTPLFTIPNLNHARQAAIINLDGNIFNAILNNLGSALKLILFQTDRLPWNSIPFYGTHYVISLPFFAIGIFTMFRKKEFDIEFIFFAWLITSFLMLTFISANINRANIIYIPIIYFIILGIYTVVDGIKSSWIPILCVYLLVFAMFLYNYFGSYQETLGYYFHNGLGDAIEYSEELDSETICVSNKINAPYIFELFYSRTDPYDYLDSVEKLNEGAAFVLISGFGRYNFSYINIYRLDKSTTYIVEKSKLEKIQNLYPDAITRVFECYIVVNFN